MPKYHHPDVQDNGPAFIRSNCDKMVMVSAYTLGDSFATVNGNIVAEVAMAPADFTFSNGAAGARLLTTAANKQDAQANVTGGGADNHFAFLDTANSKVLWVTPETTGQTITGNNPVTFPQLVYTAAALT